MSGSSQQRLRRVEQADTAYTSVLEALDAMELPPKQQIDVLLETPINDFLAKVGRRFPIGPLIDGDSIPVGTTFRSLRDKDEVVKLFPGLRHCKRVIIGDCQMDVSLHLHHRLQLVLTSVGHGFQLPSLWADRHPAENNGAMYVCRLRLH